MSLGDWVTVVVCLLAALVAAACCWDVERLHARHEHHETEHAEAADVSEEIEALHDRMDALIAAVIEHSDGVRDYLIARLGDPQPEAPVEEEPATNPTGDVIDSQHQALTQAPAVIARDIGGHTFQFRAQEQS